MSAYSSMTPRQLLEALNRIRAQYHDGEHADKPLELRGGRYCSLAKSVLYPNKTLVMFSLTRAEAIEQCERLEAGMQQHHDELADKAILDRVPHEFRMSYMEGNGFDDLLAGTRNLPRVVRMQALAFHGLSDADMDQRS